jgi:Polyketide cyclase / dehydrase and lipid transport
MPRARAKRSIHVEGKPEDVYDFALGDLQSLPDWMTSVDQVEEADPHWPAIGSSYVYSREVGRQTIRGRTTVVETDRPGRVVMREELTVSDEPVPNARPAEDREGRSVWTFESEGSGTRVAMQAVGLEMSRVTYILWRVLFSGRVGRNVQASLARLKRICETELEDAPDSGAD